MKKIPHLFLSALAAVMMSSCESAEGVGDATIGFDKPGYTFKESAGTVTIPVKFTGEPTKYPITFSVSANVDGGVDINEVARFPQILSSMRYNGNGDVLIEIELLDNLEANQDRTLTLEITSADRAEIVSGKTEILIQDNDGDLYSALQGHWTFNSIMDDGKAKSFEVRIDSGEPAEQEDNENRQRLRMLGWEGNSYTEDDPPVPYNWYMFIKTDESTGEVYLQSDPEPYLLVSPGDPFNAGLAPCSIYIAVAHLDEQGNIGADATMWFDVKASVSEDSRTISFDDDIVLMPMFLKDNKLTKYTWGKYCHNTMTR